MQSVSFRCGCPLSTGLPVSLLILAGSHPTRYFPLESGSLRFTSLCYMGKGYGMNMSLAFWFMSFWLMGMLIFHYLLVHCKFNFVLRNQHFLKRFYIPFMTGGESFINHYFL